MAKVNGWKIIFLYLKKLFNWRNLVMFLILWLILYFVMKEITTLAGSNRADIEIEISFGFLYINIFTSYTYTYLKQNNLNNFNNTKYNLLIVASVFIILNLIFYFTILFKIYYFNVQEYFVELNLYYIVWFFFTLSNCLFLFLLNVKNGFKYIYMIFVVMINLMFSLFLITGNFKNPVSIEHFKKVMTYLSLIDFSLLFLNFVKRTNSIFKEKVVFTSENDF